MPLIKVSDLLRTQGNVEELREQRLVLMLEPVTG